MLGKRLAQEERGKTALVHALRKKFLEEGIFEVTRGRIQLCLVYIWAGACP